MGNQRLTVSAPFYLKVNGPLFLALVLLMGVGPLLAWRKSTGQGLWRHLRISVAVGVVTALLLAPLLRDVITPFAFGACAFVLATIAQEYARGVRIRRNTTRESYPAAVSRVSFPGIDVATVGISSTSLSWCSVSDSSRQRRFSPRRRSTCCEESR